MTSGFKLSPCNGLAAETTCPSRCVPLRGLRLTRALFHPETGGGQHSAWLGGWLLGSWLFFFFLSSAARHRNRLFPAPAGSGEAVCPAGSASPSAAAPGVTSSGFGCSTAAAYEQEISNWVFFSLIFQ